MDHFLCEESYIQLRPKPQRLNRYYREAHLMRGSMHTSRQHLIVSECEQTTTEKVAPAQIFKSAEESQYVTLLKHNLFRDPVDVYLCIPIKHWENIYQQRC